jgi:catechol 2,3-dioxygenase-like lactoylglutathione lyase family enzyme
MGHRFSHVIVDCHDPERLARFWCAALGVEVEHRLAQYVFLTPTVAGGPALGFQRVDEPKVGKNRVHLDLLSDDLDATVAALIALGASRIDRVDEPGLRLEVLADPEGNELCVVHDG